MKKTNSIFQFERFFKEHSVPYIKTGKNVGLGWVEIKCPFCNDKSKHGGCNTRKGYFNCWKCGWYSVYDLILALGVEEKKNIPAIIKNYSTYSSNPQKVSQTKEETLSKNKKVKLPQGGGPLQNNHKKYLISRNYDPERLIKTHGLKGTGNIGPYKFRIIAPIKWKGRVVSYQGRDITGKATLKYKACSKKNELVHHQNILYGINLPSRHTSIIIVEGITDQWRIGEGSAALFGMEYNLKQIKHLNKYYTRVFILFDSGPEAKIRAEKLAALLNNLGTFTEVIDLNEGDPGELIEKDVEHLKSEFLGRVY